MTSFAEFYMERKKACAELRLKGWRTAKELARISNMSVSWVYDHPHRLSGVKVNNHWLFPPAPTVKKGMYLVVNSHSDLPMEAEQGTIAVTKDNDWVKYASNLRAWVRYIPTDEDIKQASKVAK